MLQAVSFDKPLGNQRCPWGVWGVYFEPTDLLESRMKLGLSARLGLPAGLIAVLLALLPASASAYVGRYIDGEDARVNGDVLHDNGETYDLLKKNDGVYPHPMDTVADKGNRSIKASIPERSNGTTSRSEVLLKEDMPMKTRRLVAFSVYVPSTFEPSPGTDPARNWLLFCQFWQFDPAMPAIALAIKPGTSPLKYQLIVRNDNTGPIKADAAKPYPARYAGRLQRGAWTRFVLDVKANPDSATGYVKLHVNGSHVYSFDGRMVGYSGKYDDSPNRNLNVRMGIYRTGQVDWGKQTLYFDELKYGTTLNQVL